MSSKAIAGFCIVAALAGAGIGWAAKPAPAPSTEDASVDAGVDDGRSTQAPQLQTSELMAAHARIKQLEKDVMAATVEASALRNDLVAARAGFKPPSNPAEHRAMAEALKIPRYRYEKFDKGLLEIDWKKSADSIYKLAPLISDLAQAVAAGRPPQAFQKKIQELNAPLIQVAMTLKGAQVPGDGYNGPFTHPAVAANMVYATLIEAGKPLDEQQVEMLKTIGDTFVAEELALRQREADEEFALVTFLGESNLKDRFYKAVDAMLTPEQLEILHPALMRDRVQGDLFCSGLIWPGHADAAAGATREDIAKRVADIAVRQFGIPDTDRGAVDRLVADWLQSLDEAALAPLDEIERGNFVKMSRIRAASGPMLTMYRELVREMASNPEVVTKIKESAFVLLPVIRAAK